MTAKIIAGAIGGRKAGSGWIARCPAHDDRDASLSIRDADCGKVLVYCHAGCPQTRVIAVLEARGRWQSKRRGSQIIRLKLYGAFGNRADYRDSKQTEAASRFWQAAASAPGMLIETYLRSRGLHVVPPFTIRFHAGLRHPGSGVWPAMIALVTRATDNAPLAIHRTFLSPAGADKAPVEPQKMMLGPRRGGAVRFTPCGEMLMVGEGIETCLAAMQATGSPAWTALSTSGLRTLTLPSEIGDVIVLADGDQPGEAAAFSTARRSKRDQPRIRIARPPRGFDFNDLLLVGVPGIEEHKP